MKWIIAAFFVASAACAQTPFRGDAVAISHDGVGIGFDDLRYSPSLHRVLVPAGRTGTIVLVDPANLHTTAIAGMSVEKGFGGGHGEGTTSVDEGEGRLFATDRTSQQVVVIDGERVVARAKLASGPDYVRYVAAQRELWVTEPDDDRIEIFRISKTADALTHAGFISVPGGPESLVIDAEGGRAYTHLWAGKTVAIDLKSHQIIATWPNGCEGSRGIAYDPKLHFVFAACSEGKAVVLDTAHGGRIAGTASSGAGVDIIDYDPVRRRLYFAASRSATLTIFSVGTGGELKKLRTVPIVTGAHCVTTDGKDAYVCDPSRGRILVVRDSE